MNHKRGRPKHQRAGCLLCKPHKDEREPKTLPANDTRHLQDDGGIVEALLDDGHYDFDDDDGCCCVVSGGDLKARFHFVYAHRTGEPKLTPGPCWWCVENRVPVKPYKPLTVPLWAAIKAA